MFLIAIVAFIGMAVGYLIRAADLANWAHSQYDVAMRWAIRLDRSGQRGWKWWLGAAPLMCASLIALHPIAGPATYFRARRTRKSRKTLS